MKLKYNENAIFTLKVIGAGHGDCLLIEYGDENNVHRVVIDGGTGETYEKLAEALEENPDRPLDLLVVTHVDSDHVGGILKLIQHPSFNKFADIWFNGRPHLSEDNQLEAFGAVQGERLTAALIKRNIWNEAFDKKAVSLDKAGKPVQKTLPGGATMTVISPDTAQLGRMRIRWDAEVREAGMLPTVDLPEEKKSLQYEIMGSTSAEIDKLCEPDFVQDRSAANGSSIGLIMEFRNRKILLAADAFPSVMISSIEKTTHGKPFPVDFVKVPHHGSEGNVDKEFIEAFPTSSYIFSTNGKIHRHPDAIAVARIIKYAKEPTLIFNYSHVEAKIWEQDYTKNKNTNYAYSTVYPTDENGITIKIDVRNPEK